MEVNPFLVIHPASGTAQLPMYREPESEDKTLDEIGRRLAWECATYGIGNRQNGTDLTATDWLSSLLFQ